MGLKNARQLPSNTSPVLTDIMLICDPVLGPIKKVLLSAIKALFKSYWDVDVATCLAAAEAYADALVVGLWDDRGNFNASVNAYPSSGGSGTAGAIKKGDIWTISVAGTLPTGQIVEAGDTVRALIDTPGNTQANWAIAQNNIGYTPENAANKDASGGYVGLTAWKINARNAANTITSWIVNAATSARTWTFPDKDITVAGVDDVIAASGVVENISFEDGNLAIPATTYTIELYAEYAYTINLLKIIADAGTCTAALKINGTSVTGISAISVSSSIATGTATAANTVAVGDKVTLVITSTSGLNNLQASIKTTRT